MGNCKLTRNNFDFAIASIGRFGFSLANVANVDGVPRHEDETTRGVAPSAIGSRRTRS